MPDIDTPIRTKDAADLLGEKSVKQFLRRMDRENVTPAVELPGIRGAKFWNRADLDRLAAPEANASP